jgi:adenylate cyclase
MDISLSIAFEKNLSTFRAAAGTLVVGRSQGGDAVDLNLSADTRVSRRHARVTWENGKFWIEDLGSRHGTRLNGIEIKGGGKQIFEPRSEVIVGNTTIRFEPEPGCTVEQQEGDRGTESTPDNAENPRLDLYTLDAEQSSAQRIVAILSELPARLSSDAKLDRLCQMTVETAVELIPGVEQCALLLKDRQTGQLSLQAFMPKSGYRPTVSEHLARQAMEAKKGFIWPETKDELIAQYHPVGSGMYSPLTWGNEAIGVICVDNSTRRKPFTGFGLQLTSVLSQYAAMAIAQHSGCEALIRQTEFTNRFFSSRFPPAVREELARQAVDDSLRIGTRRSLVTVLNSDIRRFTELSRDLGARRTGDLLNEYFPPLIEAVFEYGGAVERFVGDGIFAVFGALQADERQQENAVRAAVEMQRTVGELNEVRKKRRGVDSNSRVGIGLGIGIDCGEVLNGFIGNAQRLEFTVVGDAANYASRYCAGAEPGEVLISQNVHARVWKLVDCEPREIVAKHELPLTAYVVKGLVTRAHQAR